MDGEADEVSVWSCSPEVRGSNVWAEQVFQSNREDFEFPLEKIVRLLVLSQRRKASSAAPQPEWWTFPRGGRRPRLVGDPAQLSVTPSLVWPASRQRWAPPGVDGYRFLSTIEFYSWIIVLRQWENYNQIDTNLLYCSWEGTTILPQ